MVAGEQKLKVTLDIEQTLEMIREATRGAHEAVQALKQAKKDLKDTWDLIDGEIEKLIAAHVAAGLKGYDAALQNAIKKAEAAMNKRFDDLADILLGEDARAKGWPLKEFAERIAEVHRERARRCLGVDDLGDYDPERGGPVPDDGAGG